MNNLKILFKNNFNILLGTLQGKKQRKSTIVATAYLILGAIGIFALYTLQAYSMFKGLGKMHLEKVCMFHAVLTTLTVLVIIGIMRTTASSRASDADFLLSLPIKKSEIIISKTVNRYLYDLCFAFLLFVPYLVLYQIFAGFSAKVFFLGIAFLFLIPFVSVSISYLFDFFISRLFNRMRLGGLFKSFVLVFVFVLIMVLMMFKTFTYGTADFVNLDAYFADRPVSNLVLQFMFSPNIVNILVVVLVPVLSFVLAVSFYAFDFGKTFVSYSSSKPDLKFSNGNNTLSMLYKKELYSYGTTPAYIINTIIGPIMILAFGVFLSTVGYDGVCNYFGAGLDKNVLAGIFAILFSVMCATAPISACSISLEGKNMWILKSSPINEKQLFLSKILVHFSIVEPCILISAGVLSIFMGFNLLQFAIVFVCPTLLNLIICSLGIFLNLLFPKFDFDNPTKVVKQSLSVLLCMVFGILLSAVGFGIYKLFPALSIGMIFAILTAIYVSIFTVLLIVVFTKGVKLFRNIEE